MKQTAWLFRLLAASVFVLCALTQLHNVFPKVKQQHENAVNATGCPEIVSLDNVVEMGYHDATTDTEYNFLVSLHPPEEDHVLSKGIKEGLFGPKNKYPSIDEMHAICATNAECHPGRVFVEVGSAIGMVSLYMGRRGMTVYAFDPVLPNVQRLSESRCLNDARMCVGGGYGKECIAYFSQSNFHVLWNAVGSGEGPRVVRLQSEPKNMAATMRGGGSFSAEVEVTTVDESVKEDSIEILLLTCQGKEYDALLGASRFLKSGRIRHIIWRRHTTQPENTASALGIMQLLGSHGYIFYSLESARAKGESPVRMEFQTMLDYVTKLPEGNHPNILASSPVVANNSDV